MLRFESDVLSRWRARRLNCLEKLRASCFCSVLVKLRLYILSVRCDGSGQLSLRGGVVGEMGVMIDRYGYAGSLGGVSFWYL